MSRQLADIARHLVASYGHSHVLAHSAAARAGCRTSGQAAVFEREPDLIAHQAEAGDGERGVADAVVELLGYQDSTDRAPGMLTLCGHLALDRAHVAEHLAERRILRDARLQLDDHERAV